MDGFSGVNDNNDISLEKYVNKVQDFKREISKQFLAVQ
jgi:hypothetical protein